MFRVLPFGLGMRLVTIPSQYFLIGAAKEPYLDVSQQHVASKHFSGVSFLPVMVTLFRIITGGVEGGAEESHESQHREEKHRASKQTKKNSCEDDVFCRNCLPEVYPISKVVLEIFSAQSLVKSLLTNHPLTGSCGVVQQNLVQITPWRTVLAHQLLF